MMWHSHTEPCGSPGAPPTTLRQKYYPGSHTMTQINAEVPRTTLRQNYARGSRTMKRVTCGPQG